ncbi:MAG: type II toxin-antitoxin system VapC family toxin [Chloroflexi bacterium]|nr:type II toxin-antitoxin system VapC family toxin [Chloroflexota bacterium]
MDELGWLDTGVFIHALFPNDPLSIPARNVLARVAGGDASAWLDVVVVHELTYVLPRTKLPAFGQRSAVAEYIGRVLALESVHADAKDELLETLAVWRVRQVAFADARLTVMAGRRGLPVCSPNRRDFSSVPNSFPETP